MRELEQIYEIIDKSFIVSKTDLKGIITYVNENFEAISGYKKEELIGKPHNIVRHPAVPKQIFKEMWETIERGEIWEGRLQNRRKDGSSYYVKTVIAPIRDEEGKNLYYISFRQDITDLVKTKNRLALERSLFVNVLNNTNNLILIRKNGFAYKANKLFLDFFGVKNIKEFKEKVGGIHKRFVKKDGYFWSDSRSWDEKIVKKRERVVVRNDAGKEYIFDLYVSRFRLRKDRYTIITLHDITELEAAKRKALEAEHLKGEFLANISHEIRTPLTSIKGYLDLLAQEELSPKARDYLETVQNATEMILEIVNTVLDFSKLQNRRLELVPRCVDIAKIVEEIVSTLRPLAIQKGLEFRVDVEVKGCYVVDPLRLRQILMNLLSNAIKFTQTGFVELRITKDLYFVVADSGIGIPKEKLATIFEAYLQAQDDTTHRFGGTGLGLAIVKELIEMMGGAIEVESEVSKGSTFSFFLPLKSCECLVKGEKKKRQEKFCAKVLLVEDYEVNAMLFQEILSHFGIEADLAKDGQEAIKMTKEKEYDLIFMDMNMPRMNGVEAARQINKFSKIPIVALTADLLRIKENERLFDGVLAKPIALEELEQILQQYLKKDRVVDHLVREYALSKEKAQQMKGELVDHLHLLIKRGQEALEQREWERLYEVLHNLKSALGYLGFEKFSQRAKELMHAAREKKEEAYTSFFEEVLRSI